MHPTLENLCGPGKPLKAEAPDDKEIAGLLRTGIARLRDAQNTALALESRFDLAYNAAHALCLAALRRVGYRSGNRYIVFQVLPHTLGLGPEVWRVLDKCHNTRNLSEYEGMLDVDERLVTDLITATEAVSQAIHRQSTSHETHSTTRPVGHWSRKPSCCISHRADQGITIGRGACQIQTAPAPMSAQAILHFWFEELTPKQHFVQDAALDETIRARFGDLLAAAARCELFVWRATAAGRLAEIIVLDQFSRNVYRDTPRAFAQDALALVLAQELVASGQDRSLPAAQRIFAYMPYMHSESAQIHEQAMELFAQPGMENNLDFERRHKAIIDRFGRYPHRNAVLGRSCTPEELAFLNEPGSSF